MRWRVPSRVGALALALAGAAWADTGVLRPTGRARDQADALVLRSHRAEVRVDGLFATVQLTQVFENRTTGALEGEYLLRIPAGGDLSDFAIWEDGVRVPGVVIEKQRARRLYDTLTAARVDPGLVEDADTGDGDRGAFRVKVFPIPALGTKRLEVEYRLELALVGRTTQFRLPLAPDRYRRQVAGELSLSVDVRPPWPLAELVTEDPAPYGQVQPSAMSEGPEGRYTLSFRGEDVALEHDLAFRMTVLPQPGAQVRVRTHRDPRAHHVGDPLVGGRRQDPHGYFLVRYLLPDADAGGAKGRDWLLLADTSLSLRWERLELLVASLGKLLEGLGPQDRVTVVSFNEGEGTTLVEDQPGGAEAQRQALTALFARPLTGGTDLSAALARVEAFMDRPRGPRPRVAVLMTDGHPTVGELDPAALQAKVEGLAGKGRLLSVGLGEAARGGLLDRLTRAGGGFDTHLARPGPAADFALEGMRARLGQARADRVRLELDDPGQVEDVYPVEEAAAFGGETVRWVGRYHRGGAQLRGAVKARLGTQALSEAVGLTLPGHDLEAPHLPRVWARARVDFLLARIEAEGETDERIQEIVRLAKFYKLATPYTSFLAAPRALLRPRAIKPGDPVLRVRAGPEVQRVTAVLPWGRILELSRIPDEGVFEGRFLAPAWVEEGRHSVRIMLRDAAGGREVVEEHFTLDGTAPTVRLAEALPLAAPGTVIPLRVYADQDTRTLVARLDGGPPVALRYRSRGHYSEGLLRVPDLPPGRYRLRVEAEDHAHNRSSADFVLEVRG